jgi:hypothetical protein
MAFIPNIPRPFLIAAFWSACTVIGVFALLPATMPIPSTGWDKSNHALAFGLLAWLGSRCWPGLRWRVLVGLAAYGGVIEVAQASLTTTRVGEWSDWGADMAGLVVMSAYLTWCRR